MNIKKYINFDTSFSIVGALFVAFGNSFIANCIWAVGNIFLIRRNDKNGDSPQVFLFFVFEVIAVFGIINHLLGVY
jgi:hypothetical protein